MVTPQEFIERFPLYTRAELRDFTPPQSITRICDNSSCGKETTWFLRGKEFEDHVGTKPDFTIYRAAYVCGLCRASGLVVLYEKLDWEEIQVDAIRAAYQTTSVRKVGQVPPVNIEIPADIRKQLGPTAGHYKKALTCRESGFGIGALAYMRRVVDEKTDELIDVMIDLAQTFEVPQTEIDSLAKAKTEVQYEEKLRVASELIPSALRPGGVNPIGQLYKHTSVGLHGKTDDECIGIFDDLKVDFEYVFRNLHLQAQERREFAKRVQARAGKKI